MAYVPSRNISFYNRILSFNMNSIETVKDFHVVSFDAEKGLDSIGHGYLRTVLQTFEFQESLEDIDICMQIIKQLFKLLVTLNPNL